MLEKWFDEFFLHIDLDDLRTMIPWYKWEEADSFQKWAIRIMEMLLDKAFRKKLNIILDWTFWSKSATWRNIKRALKKWYNINIYYINIDPILARKYTLWREIEKKRKVPLMSFYKQYYNSFKNIKQIIKNHDSIKLIVLKKILTISWLSSKINTIHSYKEFEKNESEIKPKWNFILLFLKLLLLTIKYRVLIKKGYINHNNKYYEQNNKKDK
jgi:hypothetical protein